MRRLFLGTTFRRAVSLTAGTTGAAGGSLLLLNDDIRERTFSGISSFISPSSSSPFSSLFESLFKPNVAHGSTSAATEESGSSSSFFGNTHKERVFNNYENRIREMSAPEKVFAYFASVEREDGSMFMTVPDFLRSITPFWSAEEAEAMRRGDPELFRSTFKHLLMADVDGDGLISFDEYITYITLLSIPKRDFQLAFQMLDLNRNGTLDITEFRRVMGIMSGKSPHGAAKRSGDVQNSGLIAHFFGNDGSGELAFEDFSLFLDGLRKEILWAEFDHIARGRRAVKASEFAQFVVSYTRTRYLNRYEKKLKALDVDGEVTFEEFCAFHRLLEEIDRLELAMNLVMNKGMGFNRDDFCRASEVVAGVKQSPTVIDTVFHVFDENNDDHLSPDEFITVMKYTSTLGLQKPRDLGIVRALGRVWDAFKSEL